jgi:hypothetical protein
MSADGFQWGWRPWEQLSGASVDRLFREGYIETKSGVRITAPNVPKIHMRSPRAGTWAWADGPHFQLAVLSGRAYRETRAASGAAPAPFRDYPSCAICERPCSSTFLRLRTELIGSLCWASAVRDVRDIHEQPHGYCAACNQPPVVGVTDTPAGMLCARCLVRGVEALGGLEAALALAKSHSYGAITIVPLSLS